VTSTEEYPHLKPFHLHRGFIYKGIKVQCIYIVYILHIIVYILHILVYILHILVYILHILVYILHFLVFTITCCHLSSGVAP